MYEKKIENLMSRECVNNIHHIYNNISNDHFIEITDR